MTLTARRGDRRMRIAICEPSARAAAEELLELRSEYGVVWEIDATTLWPYQPE
jgi:hypothetical protein